MNKKLQMEFANQAGKKFTMSLDNPRENLTGQEVGEAMENIILFNVFSVDMQDLVEAKSARVISTQVEELEI